MSEAQGLLTTCSTQSNHRQSYRQINNALNLYGLLRNNNYSIGEPYSYLETFVWLSEFTGELDSVHNDICSGLPKVYL